MVDAAPLSLPAPPWRRRLPQIASVAYVGALALRADGGLTTGAWLAGVAAIVVAVVASRRPSRAAQWIGWGVAVVLASLCARAESRALDACGALGALVCAAAACAAVARMPGAAGLNRAAPWSPRPVVAALAAGWAMAIAAALAPAVGVLQALRERPHAWGFAAAALTVAALFGATEWSVRRRWLELGVVERAVAMRALLVIACVGAAIGGLVAQARIDATGRVAVAAAALVLGLAALTPDPVRVARVTRRLVALAIVGGGIALLGASAAEGRSWGATLVTAVAALAVGATGRFIEAPLRPMRGAWLDAFDRASARAPQGDPQDAVREILATLRGTGSPSAPSPELWTFGPNRVLTVDAAGYAREREGELPETIALLAAGEPEGTLRADVVHALEVRRADLRPPARWMADRDVLLVTVIASEGDIEGLLVMPRVARDELVTLEELRALRLVADQLAGACRTRHAHERLLARARDAGVRADAAEERLERLRHERALDVGRDALATARLARPATVGIYSTASRTALEALERRTLVGAPVAIVAPSGVDPVPYLARAHLSGARRDASMVLVDATSAREHDVARWVDPNASPLALADRGMLVLLDGAALPSGVQQIVARALAEKRAPWERPDTLDVQLALTGVFPPEELVTQGRLDAALALRLADARHTPIVLPRMRDRPEDLRALVTDRLAREGLRLLGRPVGMDHAAFARLVDHPFPGEEAELASIVQQLVARCQGDVVRAADVDALAIPGISRGAIDVQTGAIDGGGGAWPPRRVPDAGAASQRKSRAKGPRRA